MLRYLRPVLVLILALTMLSWSVPQSIAFDTYAAPIEQSISSAAAAPVSLKTLSRLTGHSVTALAISGNHAYAGYGSGLTVLDISNPSQIRQVGFTIVQGIIYDITIAGRYAAVAVLNYGVRIVDINNPVAPVVVGALTDWAEEVAFVGSYLYVSGRQGAYSALQVVDLANPAAPRIIHSLPLEIGDLAVHGPNVYLSFHGGGFHSLDASNPADPRLVSTYTMDTPGQYWNVSAVTADDRYVYFSFAPLPHCCPDMASLTLPEASGLMIVDISDPAVPRQVGYVAMAQAQAMAIVGHYLYVAADRVWVVDVSTPTASLIVGSAATSGWAGQLLIDGTYTYIGSGHAVRAFDNTEPTSPTPLGTYQGFPDFMNDVAIASGYAYIATYSGLRIVDLSDPARPTIVGSLAGAFQGVVVQGRYVYAKVPDIAGAEELWVVDVANPAKPSRVGMLPGIGGKFEIQGQYLYSLTDKVLSIVDVSSPTVPKKLGELTGVYIPYISLNIAIAGRYLYTAAGHVVDIADPSAPAVIGMLPRSGEWVAVAGSYAYIAGSSLWVIDITNPTAAKVVGSLAGNVARLAVANEYVYLTSLTRYSDAFVRVVDVSNPAMPRQIGSYNGVALNCTPEVALIGQEIYLSCAELLILRDTGLAISGQLRYANGTAAPLANVPITSSDGRVSFSDANGSYTFKNLLSGSYILTATLSGASIWPSSRIAQLPRDSRGQDFIILPSPVSATVAPSTAATLILTDTQGLRTRLTMPTAALTQSTTLSLTPRIEANQFGSVFTGHAFELSARRGNQALPALTFGAPVQLSITYSDLDIQVTSDESKLALWWWNGASWQEAAETCSPASSYQRNLAGNTLTVPICRTGRFVLFGPTHHTLLPLSLRAAT